MVRFLTLMLVISSSGFAHSSVPQQPPADPTSLALQMTSDFFAKRFEAITPHFDSRMASALPASKLSGIRDQLLGQAGPFQSIVTVHAGVQQGFRMVAVTCKFQNAVLDVVWAFDSNGQVGGLHFVPSQSNVEWSPPEYASHKSFKEHHVTVVDGQWKLPGTLSLPDGPGPFPAVVLVQGSGPADEDETIGPNKPFKDLAWGLASQRIAVLRYVKRTRQYAAQLGKHLAGFTVNDETVDDARAAVSLLASEPGIDHARIYVLGHSLGGAMAPRIAQESAHVAGIIIMAGATIPMERATVEQLKYLARLSGGSAAAEKQVQEAEAAEQKIENPALAPGDEINFLGAMTPGSYWLSLRGYHPEAVAASLKIPILVLQGSRDYQVTYENFAAWQKALASDPRATFKLFPGLTHFFTPSATPGNGLGTPADYFQPEHVSGAVVTEIASWINSPGKGAK